MYILSIPEVRREARASCSSGDDARCEAEETTKNCLRHSWFFAAEDASSEGSFKKVLPAALTFPGGRVTIREGHRLSQTLRPHLIGSREWRLSSGRGAGKRSTNSESCFALPLFITGYCLLCACSSVADRARQLSTAISGHEPKETSAACSAQRLISHAPGFCPKARSAIGGSVACVGGFGAS